MSTPDPERQVQFLFNVQRLISDGSFVATYKFALLLALADLAVERGDDTTESLPLDTLDLAEKFVDLYWRQVLPWVSARSGGSGRLAQATSQRAAVLNRVASAHERFQGSLPRLRRDKAAWARLLREVARTIQVMPLWKLQTVGPDKLHLLYPNVGTGDRIVLRGEAVYCAQRAPGLDGGARREDAPSRPPTHEADRRLGLRPGRARRRHRLAAGARRPDRPRPSMARPASPVGRASAGCPPVPWPGPSPEARRRAPTRLSPDGSERIQGPLA